MFILENYLNQYAKKTSIDDDNIYEMRENAILQQAICEEYINHKININEFNDLNELFGLTNSDEFDNIMEGANLDSRRYYKTFKKQIKNNIKKGKKALRNKNYKEAKKYLNEASKNLEECKNKIKDCDSTAGSFIFGLLTNILPILGRELLLSLIPLTFGIKVGTEVASALVNAVWGDLGNGGNLEKVFDDIVQKNKPLATASKISGKIRDLLPIVIEIYRIAKNIKEKHKNGESISIDDFNLYKNMLLQKLAEYQTYLNLLIKKCDEAK